MPLSCTTLPALTLWSAPALATGGSFDAPDVTHAENSEVSPVGDVAVAVIRTTAPIGKSGSVALPLASVATDTDPTRLCPSRCLRDRSSR